MSNDSIQFLGMEFKPLSLANKQLFESFFERYPQKNSTYLFASLLSWSEIYKFHWALLEKETLLISPYIKIWNERHLLQPIGLFPERHQQLLLNTLQKNPYPIKFLEVSDAFMQQHSSFCARFTIVDIRESANYLYKATDLAQLSGRRYEKKRNLIAQAEKSYKWTVSPLCELSLPCCPQILLDIGSKEMDQIPLSLLDELTGLKYLLSHFEELGQKGLMISIDDIPVAFSIYGKLNPTTAVVLFEKALRFYKGLFQVINRETAKAILQEGYLLINREEDLGIEGLRKAKLSYFPVELVSSFRLEEVRL